MDKKTMALTLLLVTVSAAIFAGLAVNTFAAETNTTGTNTTAATTFETTIPDLSGETSFRFWGSDMMIEQGIPGGRGHGRMFGGSQGLIELSSAFNQTINNILGNDTDVQKLISQGYNLTAVRPKLSTTLSGDGTLTTKATSATVTLQNGTSGYAIVKVDVTNSKVAEIVIFTRTVIDKSTT